MGESDDSDYNVEEYITPTITRHTYNKTDDSYLSDEGDFKESSESENEDSDEVNLEIETQCKLPKVDRNLEKKEGKVENNEPIKTNNRFILYVSNLPPETSKQMLETLFMDCGKIKSVRIPKKRLGNFAFVEMFDIEGLKNGLKLDGKEMGEKKIRVHTGSKIKCPPKFKKMNFHEFLKNKLKSFKIDVGVYHSYLLGILEDNIDEDEKREMLTDIISSLIESDVDILVNEIFEKWSESSTGQKSIQTNAATNAKKSQEAEKVDLAKMLETSAKIAQQSSTQHNRQLTEEEKRIKQQILASYSQTSDKEEDDDEENGENDDDDPNLEKNTNKSDVQKLAKEKREQAKLDSLQKKQKDKEDRAKQKASRDEKKEKRKAAAVKGERRR
ncbi:hypothetical protein PVAND_010948 [Polypedilum vanderplanki]|uniref:Coiled-coil domain-containing protein 43 n=1 Tax=Polypedilum vanderplanki TaxID=319348 RepID=A0A9J6CH36_POLVA|nr:hypothetical protein PVAND_010948 [Polypedilum vanderplanki]